MKLNHSQRDALTHALRTAEAAFRESQAALTQAADAGGNPMMTAEAARRLADSFAGYVDGCETLYALFDAAETVEVNDLLCAECGEPVETVAGFQIEGGALLCEDCAD
ncbi:MAG: hypothetical protein ACYTFT_03380 [Planctomycetota bacterium]